MNTAAQRPFIFCRALLPALNRSLLLIAVKGKTVVLTAPPFIQLPVNTLASFFILNCDSNKGICTMIESSFACISVTRMRSDALRIYQTGFPFSVTHSKLNTMFWPSVRCSCACHQVTDGFCCTLALKTNNKIRSEQVNNLISVQQYSAMIVKKINAW